MLFRHHHQYILLGILIMLVGVWGVPPIAPAQDIQVQDAWIIAKNGGYGPGDGTGNGGSGPKDGTGNGAKKGSCSFQSVSQKELWLVGKGKGKMHGPGDGSGNGGNGPKDGSGYGPGSC